MSAPDDVLIDILLRLPVDCVIRFRCVSKHWSFLTRNSNFIAAHLSRSNSKDEDDDDDFSLIGLVQCNTEISTVDYDYIISREDECPARLVCLSGADFRVRNDIEIPSRARDYCWPELSGFCNGILCLTYGYYAGIALWNPAIGEVKLVPPIVRRLPLELTDTLSIRIRFGYDSKTDDYKVLRLVNFHDDACCYTHLYSLATDSWKELDQHREFSSGPLDKAYVNADGVFYWYGEDAILSFDMVDEKFHEIPRPTGYGHNLVNWKGSLGLCCYHRETEETKEYHIWVLNTDGESWTSLLKIRTTDLDPDLDFYRVYLIGPRNHGEIIFLLLSDCGSWTILVFDPQTQETRTLRPPLYCGEPIYRIYSYKASLVTLKGAVEIDEHDFCNMLIDPYFSFLSNPPDFAERKH